jgi:hypothetical protein
MMPYNQYTIVERGNIDTPNTQIHDHSFSWLCTGVPITSGGVKLVRLAQTSPHGIFIQVDLGDSICLQNGLLH